MCWIHLLMTNNYISLDFKTRNNVITPFNLVKDRQGDITSIDNYRGITLSQLFAKLFQHCIMDK